jgi:hypothetical protein
VLVGVLGLRLDIFSGAGELEFECGRFVDERLDRTSPGAKDQLELLKYSRYAITELLSGKNQMSPVVGCT